MNNEQSSEILFEGCISKSINYDFVSPKFIAINSSHYNVQNKIKQRIIYYWFKN